MPIRLPNMPTAPTARMSSVRMPSIAPRTPNLAVDASTMRVSGSDMAAPFAALSDLGGAIAGFGDKIGRIAIAQADTARTNTLAEIDIEAKTAFGALETDFTLDPDPATRISRFDEVASGVKERAMKRDMDPVTRKQAELSLRGMEAAYRTRVATQSAAAMVSQEKGRANNVVSRYVDMGEPDKAIGHIEALPEYVMAPEEKEAAIYKIKQSAADRDVYQFVAQDPRNAKTWLEERGDDGTYTNAREIPFERRQQLIGHAERETNRKRAEYADGLIARSNRGGNDAPTVPEIIAAQDEGNLDPQAAYTLIHRLEAQTPPADDPEIVDDTIRRIEAFDRAADYQSNDAEKTAILQTIATEFSPARQQTLMARFKQKLEGDPTTPYAGRIRAYLEAARNDGAFGKFQTKVRETYTDENGDPATRWTTKIDPTARRRTYERYFETLDKVDQFLATPEAAKLPSAELFRQIQTMLPRDPAQAKGAQSILGGKRTQIDRMEALFSNEPQPKPMNTAHTFGGIPTPPIGKSWQNVEATVFGWKNDPNDAGINHRGQPIGPGALEGVAVPQSVMTAYGMPKKADVDKARAIVRNGSRISVLPIVDRGTAENVVQDAGRMKLDLTEGAAKAIGATPLYKDGKLAGLTGAQSVSFAVVKLPDIQWQGAQWEAIRQKIIDDARDVDTETLTNTLTAAKHEWARVNSAR